MSDAVINHIKRTCPHFNNPSRQALRNNRLDLYLWKDEPELIPINLELKNNCKPCSKKDVKKYTALIKRGSLPPAIVISEDFKILDGAHRLQALINEGHTEVLAFTGTKSGI